KAEPTNPCLSYTALVGIFAARSPASAPLLFMDKPASRKAHSLEQAARDMQALWGEKAEHVALQRATWADQLDLAQSAQTWRAVAQAVRGLTDSDGTPAA